MIRVAAWSLAAILITAGLAAHAGEQDTSLVGTRWTLVTLGKSMPSQPALTLNFEANGSVNGHDGCNSFQTVYKSTGSTMQIGPQLSGTLMACPDDIEEKARAYRETLTRTTRFERVAADLHLLDAGGHVLARFTTTTLSLPGSKWEVISYNNGKQAVVSVIIGSHITAQFGDDGLVTGSAGCNQYFATFSVKNAAIEIGKPQVTRQTCDTPQNVMNQESLFLEALQTGAKIDTRGDLLELRTISGALAVQLKRVDK